MCWVDVCFYDFIILQTDRWRIKQASLPFKRKMIYLVVPDRFSASHSRESYHWFLPKSRTVYSLWCWTVKKNLSQGLFKSFEFSRQKLKKKKYGAHNTRAPFFKKIGSVSNICSNAENFPAKRLRKIRCSKIRMRRFFFFFNIIYSVK